MTTHALDYLQLLAHMPGALVGKKLSHRKILWLLTKGSRSFWLLSFLTLLVVPLIAVAAEDKVARQLDELLNGSCQTTAPGFRWPSFSTANAFMRKGMGWPTLSTISRSRRKP